MMMMMTWCSRKVSLLLGRRIRFRVRVCVLLILSEASDGSKSFGLISQLKIFRYFLVLENSLLRTYTVSFISSFLVLLLATKM